MSVQNLLDYPSVTLPITRVDAAIDLADNEYHPVSGDDKINNDMYDEELFDGMPVCLQLVGKPLTEEHLLEVATAVDEACR